MRLELFIADHFETLASGKLLAVGLFSDRVIILQVPADAPEPSADMPFGIDLGLLLTVADARRETRLEGDVRVLPPGGSRAAALRFEGITVAPGRSANIVTKLAPFLIPAAGVFTVELHAAGEVLRASFEVRINRLPSKASADAPVEPAAAIASAADVRKAAATKRARRTPKA